MNWRQCQRWKGFSIRMARRGSKNITSARREKIEDQIYNFFDCCVNSDAEWRNMTDWDGAKDSICVTDEVGDYFSDLLPWKPRSDGTYYTKFVNQITCCIRAGFDCAVEPSAGVIGFSIGDLRRMYPDGIPEWILSGYEGLETANNSDAIWL